MRKPTLSCAQISSIVNGSVCSATHVSFNEIRHMERGLASVALARHLAIYLCHVVGGFNYSKIAIEFRRDRTTVQHACSRVEMLRDSTNLDSALDCLETSLSAFFNTIERVCHECLHAIESDHNFNSESAAKQQGFKL